MPDLIDHEDTDHPFHVEVRAGTKVVIDWKFPHGVHREEYTAPPADVVRARQSESPEKDPV